MDTIESGRGPKEGPRPDVPAETVRHVWEAKDGTPVLVRAIAPDDFGIELDFVDGLSNESGYMRLMSRRRPTDDEMYRWTHLDRAREGAVIATIWVDGRERQIGVARYAMEEGALDAAEVAIVISDAWQGQGLGSRLLSSLIELARQSGVRRLFGEALGENRAMIGLALHLGFRLSHQPGATFVMERTLDSHSTS